MGSFPKWVKWVLIINVVAISGTEKVFQKDFFVQEIAWVVFFCDVMNDFFAVQMWIVDDVCKDGVLGLKIHKP